MDRWGPDGTILFVPAHDAIDLGAPAALFTTDRATLVSARTDGGRFLVATQSEDVEAAPLTVIVNWRRGRP